VLWLKLNYCYYYKPIFTMYHCQYEH
jgi:hypothetical protein